MTAVRVMATVDFSLLAAPLSDTELCGPDLEAADDPEYMQFVARVEGLLPETYFIRDEEEGRVIPFNRSKQRSRIDFNAETKAIKVFLARTRDLRLLVLLAKLLVLNGQIGDFADCCSSVGSLLRARWDNVHPQLHEGDATMRVAILQSLDDLAPVVTPLQHASLFQSRRYGPISYRTYLVATGDVRPLEGEDALDRTALDHAFAEADLPALITVHDSLRTLEQALNTIRAACVEQAGFEQAVNFERLSPIVGRMLGVLDAVIAKRDPSAARPAVPPASSSSTAKAPDALGAAATGSAPSAVGRAGTLLDIPSGRIVSTAAAAAALAAVVAYFTAREPSSPAVLLVRQAEQLVGKSFYEVMQILIPDQADQAVILVGGEQPFNLPVERLSSIAPEQAYADGVTMGADDSSTGFDGEPIEAKTREEALLLLQQIGAFYRRVEPSSPIPLLADRALALASCDFLSLLKDLLPKPAHQAQEGAA